MLLVALSSFCSVGCIVVIIVLVVMCRWFDSGGASNACECWRMSLLCLFGASITILLCGDMLI